MKKHYRQLRWLLGDQLNENHSWFIEVDDEVLYVIAELPQETSYVRHHVQKLCAFFAAMAAFAGSLRARGHHVLHLTLDDSCEYSDLNATIAALIQRFDATEFHYQRPDEYRLLQQFENLDLAETVAIHRADTEHFLLPFAQINEHFPRGKHVRMESFYRRMRLRFNVLMEGDEPAGGKWNYDQQNRQKLKKSHLSEIPAPLTFGTDVGDILERLQRHAVEHFGSACDPLPWPVTRAQALQLLDYFCEQCLCQFGRFQDAMTANSEHSWSLYHSRLSFALNTKLLAPREVMDTAIARYHATGHIDLAQVEGFVRQILGWREYVRGVYWANMPDYAGLNHYQASRPLPEFFWTGKTHMRCMQQAIEQSLDHAYAHHIQRLMVTGNFALLAGIDPDQLDQWYLGIYIDAIEWVEMPNTRGMSQYADGGIVGTKPYAAGGNYINKMSDYCASCHYKVAEKTGDRACPLNSLYWHFMQRHRAELSRNQRIGMIYGNWDRMGRDKQQAILAHAEDSLANLESL